MTKEKALFYFKRYLRDIEEKATFDQQEAAKSGFSYGERIRMAEEAKKYQDEYEALTWIHERILELKGW